MSQPLTLYQLQEQIREAVARHLDGVLWVVAEVSELKVNASGHCYLELVERDEGGKTPVAQVRAVIWSSTYKLLAHYFQFETGTPLAAGMKILVQGSVNYHPLYGLSLSISDIDPAYTLGEAERLRRQTLEQLRQEGVIDMNRELPLPEVPQRLAVVSSAQAAGFQDFQKQIEASPYRFEWTLFEATVQGAQAEEQLIEALDRIAAQADRFDAVVLIRGGGSQSDLSCFDSYLLCANVAQFPLPVLTGIGHDKDVSLVDHVAHTAFKTPTAVAAFLIERAAAAAQRLDQAYERLTAAAKQLLVESSRRLEQAAYRVAVRSRELFAARQALLERQAQQVQFAAQGACDTRSRQLERWNEQLRASASLLFERQTARWQQAAVVVEAANPRRLLERGYALLRTPQGRPDSLAALHVGQSIEIELRDGRLEAEIHALFPAQKP